MTALFASLALRWGLLPAWARRAIPIAAAVLLIGAGCAIWLARHDRGVITTHEAAVTAKVIKRTETAETVAARTVAAAQTELDHRHETARAAADGSDDPLRAGFDSLRRTRPAPGPDPR